CSPAGAPSGVIPNGTTWLGEDGRIWKANGSVIKVPAASGGGANRPDLFFHRADEPHRDFRETDLQYLRYKG
ncbi:unnamed protein product, partial [marine sediment metagenome]